MFEVGVMTMFVREVTFNDGVMKGVTFYDGVIRGVTFYDGVVRGVTFYDGVVRGVTFYDGVKNPLTHTYQYYIFPVVSLLFGNDLVGCITFGTIIIYINIYF